MYSMTAARLTCRTLASRVVMWYALGMAAQEQTRKAVRMVRMRPSIPQQEGVCLAQIWCFSPMQGCGCACGTLALLPGAAGSPISCGCLCEGVGQPMFSCLTLTVVSQRVWSLLHALVLREASLTPGLTQLPAVNTRAQ